MTVTLGVLSAAHPHAASYVTAVGDIDGAEVVAIADGDTERGRAFADEHDIVYDSPDAVLDRIDAAVVCAANADHAAWVERAADASVDVLCEKPLATTVATADDMVEICADRDVSLGVAMPVRFAEPARHAKAAVESGEIGEVRAFVGTNLLKWMTDGGWFVDPERSGGGAIMDHSVHVIDIVRWISGREVTEVYAESGTAFADIPVEDIDVLSMELADGTPVTHDGSWRQPEQYDTWGDVTLRIVGTEGVLEVDCFDQTFKHTRETGDDPGIGSVYWGSSMDKGLLDDFVAAVREGRDPAIPGEEGARELRVVEAAYESVETGEPVSVEY